VNARDSIKRMLRGEHRAPAFLPELEALAPALAGCSAAAMTASASSWVSGLQQATHLLSSDALCIGFDPRHAIASCRANMAEPEMTAPMAVLFDAADRLFAENRNQLACVIALAGPATMAAHLAPGAGEREAMAAIKPAATRLVEQACRLRPDLVVFVEEEGRLAAGPSPELRRLLATLRRVAAHYGVATGIKAPGGTGLEALGCEVLFQDAASPPPSTSWQAIVVALPNDPHQAGQMARQTLAGRPPQGPAIAFGITGLAPTADFEQLRSIQATIAALAA